MPSRQGDNSGSLDGQGGRRSNRDNRRHPYPPHRVNARGRRSNSVSNAMINGYDHGHLNDDVSDLAIGSNGGPVNGVGNSHVNGMPNGNSSITANGHAEGPGIPSSAGILFALPTTNAFDENADYGDEDNDDDDDNYRISTRLPPSSRDVDLAHILRPRTPIPPSGNSPRNSRALSPSQPEPPRHTHDPDPFTGEFHATNCALAQDLHNQNTMLYAALETERATQEELRRRTFDLFNEEQRIMEGVRTSWAHEKHLLTQDILRSRTILQQYESEIVDLKAKLEVAETRAKVAEIEVETIKSEAEAAMKASSNSESSTPLAEATVISQTMTSVVEVGTFSEHPPSESLSLSLPLGLDGASRRPHHIQHISAKHSQSSPARLAESSLSSFTPLDPRMQPQTASPKDFLASSSDEHGGQSSVIDIQELDPKLEGVPIKATAVQRSTFGKCSSQPISPSASSPTTASESKDCQEQSSSMPMVFKRGSSAHTLEILKAEESRRLTMHAGHTPNHSLSLFSTLKAAANNTSVVGNESPVIATDQANGESSLGKVKEEQNEDDVASVGNDDMQDPEELMEASHDVRLKGPLMIKNIPAQDEIFWDKLNAKLEEEKDSLPAAMRSPHGEEVDSVHSLQNGTEDKGIDKAQKDVEVDVPLKLKSTTNFGAPFGMT